MNKHQIRNSLILLLTATIWGAAFVAQSVGMAYIGPLTFTSVRFLIGGLFLLPCIKGINYYKQCMGQRDLIREDTQNEQSADLKTLVISGIACGTVLCLASGMQQYAIGYTSAGKAGFITAFYIIIVPILGLFFKQKCSVGVWVGVILALVGLYFLCITDGFAVEKYDILLLGCAILFSVHIIIINKVADQVEPMKLSCIQFFVAGILSGIGMVLFEKPQMHLILAAWKPVLYTGILSSGVAYTLQIVGQKGMNPTIASLIMSLESVISVIAGFIILHESLSIRELIGCLFMFVAIILAQLPQRKKVSNKRQTHSIDETMCSGRKAL